MEEYLKVMEQVIELTETMLEGLLHVQKLVGAGKFEDSVNLLEDVVASFASVEQSIATIKEKLDTHNLDTSSKNVQQALDLVIGAYEMKNYSKVQEMMQFTVIPRFQKWQKGWAQAFHPYLAS